MKGISTHHIRISNRAHVIFPYHIELDVSRRAKDQVGTTKRESVLVIQINMHVLNPYG